MCDPALILAALLARLRQALRCDNFAIDQTRGSETRVCSTVFTSVNRIRRRLTGRALLCEANVRTERYSGESQYNSNRFFHCDCGPERATRFSPPRMSTPTLGDGLELRQK